MNKTKIPGSVDIGPFTFQVRQSRNFAAFNSLWGQAKSAELLIEMESDVADCQKWQVLFHEFMHVADEIYHFQLPEENKDDIIDRIATCFYAFLHDNNLLKE